MELIVKQFFRFLKENESFSKFIIGYKNTSFKIKKFNEKKFTQKNLIFSSYIHK